MKSEMPIPNTVLEIDFSLIRSNIQELKVKLRSGTKLMLMFKAEAYGTEAVELAKQIEKEQLADYLAVAYMEEGTQLRKAGISLPILLLNPNESNWEPMIKNCLEPEIHRLDQLNSFIGFLDAQTGRPQEYPIHIHFNTGMNHVGLAADQVPDLIEILSKSNSCKVKSLMSHLSSSDMPSEDSFTQTQIDLFQTVSEQVVSRLNYPVMRHILNSNGLERFSEAQFDMARIGIGMHGASEFTIGNKKRKPISRLITKVCSIRKVGKGDTIGYMRSGIAKDNTNIASLSIGYADGLSRELGNGNWKVEINGKLYPTIGNVCMNLCMVDLRGDTIEIGEDAIIFGGKLNIFDFARAQNTITYEAMTRIGIRVKRRIIGV